MTFISREYNLLYKYGVGLKEYMRMLKEQRGVCQICGTPPTPKDHKPGKDGGRYLCIDHDHVTKKIRGLLCGNCNKGLGMFKDNPELLSRAIDYLSQTPRK